MKPIITQEEATYYISEADMIKFISENAPMEWNTTCGYIRKVGITDDEGGRTYWTKESVFDEKKEKHYNKESVQWMRNFFNAHPFMEKIMIVFDD